MIPTSKLPIVIGKKTPPPAGPIEFDPFYIKPPITGKGLPKGIETPNNFWSTKKSLGVGITRRIYGGESKPILKRYPRKPTKPDIGTEEKISNALVLLMKDPKLKPFTETKIPLGVSDKILQIREGKVIQDTITKKKTKLSSEPFSPPSRLGVGGTGFANAEIPIYYPPSTSILLGPIIIPQEQNLESQTQISQEISSPTRLKETEKYQSPTKIKIDSLVIHDLKPKQETKPQLATSLLYGTTPITIQTTAQTPRLQEKQRTRQPWPTPLRQPSKLIQPLKEKERSKLIQKLIEPPPKPIPRLIPKFDLPKERPKKRKELKEPKSAFDWKGNVPEFKIEGIYKKYDIIYGEKRIAKLLKQEQFGKPKRRDKEKTDLLGFPKTKKSKSNKWVF